MDGDRPFVNCPFINLMLIDSLRAIPPQIVASLSSTGKNQGEQIRSKKPPPPGPNLSFWVKFWQLFSRMQPHQYPDRANFYQ